MAASYKKLFKLLIDREMKSKELAAKAGISPATLAKMKKDGATVSSDVLVKICTALDCKLDDIKEKSMITFNQIKKLFAFETQGKYSVEILFSVNGTTRFDSCWMGKMPDKVTAKDVYWFGLTSDGKNAFDYSTFEDFSTAKVFDGKSLIEIWDAVTVEEIDGCEPLKRLENYIGENK